MVKYSILLTKFKGKSLLSNLCVCSSMDDNIVIEGRTFIVDKKHIIDKVDNESFFDIRMICIYEEWMIESEIS